MTEVLNLESLRGIVGQFEGELYYALGHSSIGDGGGGIFMWRTSAIFTGIGLYNQDNNGTIVQAIIDGIPDDSGRWVRQYDGDINVLFFGAFGTYEASSLETSYTTRIQNAIDFAALNFVINANNSSPNSSPPRGSTVFIPNGSYLISNLLLKNGVTLIGESMDKTILYATPGNDGDFMFEIESGPVIINVSNLNLSGQETARGAFFFESNFQSSEPFHGGLWNSRISDINIYGFLGHSIYLKGGGTNSIFLLPNQFTIFENVRVFNFSDDNNSLRITGQNGQLSFINCEFDGYSVYDAENDEYKFKKGKNIWIESIAQFVPAVITFLNCTSQYADYGIYILWAENVSIDNCWFEQLGVAISVNSNIQEQDNDNPSKGINIVNNRFANAAGFGSLNAPNNLKDGQCIYVSRSFVNVNNNYVTVTDVDGIYLNSSTRFIVANNNTTGGVSAENNTFKVDKLGITFGILQKIIVQTDNSINCSGHKLLFLDQEATATNPSPNPHVKIIHSSINAGEYLTIRAYKGKVVFYNTDNIFFKTPNTSNSFAIDDGDIVTFVKIDDIIGTVTNPIYQSYQLVSVMRDII
nr:glycosyl hydrolase family 28-related protein [uncultured Flavobacterium sp.]